MFDWKKKSMGEPWEHPENCLVCGAPLNVKGWSIFGDFVTCYACNSMFKEDGKAA